MVQRPPEIVVQRPPEIEVQRLLEVSLLVARMDYLLLEEIM
jgi:hypothetical protein